MRIALKIAYDGRAFYGHQRQPDRRTVEGECIAALKATKILRDPREAFFRSASRTDRGVSAIGNVIAFNASLPPDAVVGAFNDKARGVWAWAVAEVPEGFHPRHAAERWYRYFLFDDLGLDALREAAQAFVGTHDFRSFSSDPVEGPFTIGSIEVTREQEGIYIDVRARSFRRGMVRRIVAAMTEFARGEVTLDDLAKALEGAKRDFGSVPAEPLVLMDVKYEFPWRVLLKPKVLTEWNDYETDLRFRLRFLRELRTLVRVPAHREGRESADPFWPRP
ncbi:MAG TPA: tRNA pseudouridine(38-40) synthase TruA [Thermoplasmata archaeon]|jgi:tRNA pseudouridine38-40 synthase